MKLTDELKKRIDNAASEEEVRDILDGVREMTENAGVILDDEELDQAAGGIGRVILPSSFYDTQNAQR